MIGALSGDAVVSIPWMSTLRGPLRRSGFSAARPNADIPRYVDLYMAGKLRFDELVTGRFPLSDFNRRRRGDGARRGRAQHHPPQRVGEREPGEP